jgi:chaperonin GroEL
LQNKIKGMLNVLAIKAPSYQQQHILKDLSIVLGAKFISNEAVPDLKIVTPEDLGYAESVTSSKDATVFVGGGGEKKAITDRILSIKTQIDEETNEFNKQKLRERLAKLSGGIYVVRVGGQTEVEIEDKKERIDDAIQATRAAMKEGIIPGGEIVYLSAIKALKPENENEEYAFRILSRALLLPFSRLMENSGFDAGEMRQKIEDKPPDYGVDVTTGKIVDMFNSGIIDPTLVATEAIRNGVSVASMIILSDGIIVEKEEEVKK